jgi:8-oxo-dGTP pyrophosphatase MutT (NUDIX family)
MKANELASGAASAVIWSRADDTVLTLLRSDLVANPLEWCWPGGHMEPGETPKAALYRELQEEIGHDLSHHPVTLLTRRETTEPVFVHSTYAICVPRAFEPQLNWEHVDHAWTSMEELPQPMAWYSGLLFANDSAAARYKHFIERHRKVG